VGEHGRRLAAARTILFVRREPIDDGRPQLIQNGKRLTQAPIIAKPIAIQRKHLSLNCGYHLLVAWAAQSPSRPQPGATSR
jgi:hypothetical protein